MRGRLFSCVLAMMLAGCATLPARAPLTAGQQRDHLQSLGSFSFTGRVAIKGQSATITWRQRRNDASVRLSMSGIGGLRVEHSPARLRIETRGGVKLDGEAEELLIEELGFVPPFEALRYWVLGLAAPGSPAGQSADADGRLQQLEQQGWLIAYTRYADVPAAAGMLRLPDRLNATRGDLGLRLVIDRWRLE